VRAGAVPEPDAIFTALGSGGTVAGLVLGCRLAGLRSRIVAVLVTDILPPSPARLAGLARSSLRRLREIEPGLPPIELQAGDFTIVRGYVGRAYGAETEAGSAAQRLLADAEGITLEPTYTAKCLAALLDLAAQPPYREQTVLFWNTYNSVDVDAAVGPLPDWRSLPRPFHRFF
jgi:D-cysteine desulfhydrase